MYKKKSQKEKYPVVYIGPTIRGLHHGTVLRDREALLNAQMRYPGQTLQEEFIEASEAAEAESQIRAKSGYYYLVYKKGEKNV